jgi:hypothetical protein
MSMSEFEIATIVANKLKSDIESVNDLLSVARDELFTLHHTLGRSIRNEFLLWAKAWTPDLIDGVDYSNDHPDAISSRIIEQVWDMLYTEYRAK